MPASERRSYGQHCGLARGLDVLGERWTLLIVRSLLLGPRRYSDLLRELGGMTTNLLAKRLKEMESVGIIARDERPPPLAISLYRLTELGLALEPVVMEIGRWGGRFLDHQRKGDVFNIAWGLLSLKRRYRGGLTAVIGLRIDERCFELAFSETYLSVQEREAVRPDSIATGKLAPFRALLFGGASASELRDAGQLSVEGSAAAFRSMLSALDGCRR